MGEVLFEMGRCFGYAYGHKENGAMFSHMAVMFGYALYECGLAREGWRVLDTIYRQSVNFATSRMYPGIPEYFSERGRGMYPYLTGSASWYLLTLVNKTFGVQGEMGDLLLKPMLVKEQFGEQGSISITTLFASRQLQVTYLNPRGLDYGAYQVQQVRLDGQKIDHAAGEQARLPRAAILALPAGQVHHLEVTLG